KHFSIDTDITPIRTAPAGDGPIGYDFASREVDDGNTAFPLGRPIHASNPSVSHVEPRAVPAWVKSVGAETGFDVAELHEFVTVDNKYSLGLHVGDVENFAIRGDANVLGHTAF